MPTVIKVQKAPVAAFELYYCTLSENFGQGQRLLKYSTFSCSTEKFISGVKQLSVIELN